MYKLFFPLIYIVLPTYLFSTDTEILLHACTQKETNWCYTQTHHPGVNKAGKKKKKQLKPNVINITILRDITIYCKFSFKMSITF